MPDTTKLLSSARHNLNRGCGARLACVAIARPQEWISLGFSLVLGPQAALRAMSTEEDVRVGELVVFVRQFGLKEVPAVLEMIAGGTLNMPVVRADAPVRLGPTNVGSDFHFTDPMNHEAATKVLAQYGVPYGGYECVATPDQLSQVLDWPALQSIERRLPASPAVARSLSDLAARFLIASDLSRERRIAVVSPVWMKIVSVEPHPSERAIDVEIESHWQDTVERSTLSAISTSKSQPFTSATVPFEPKPAHPPGVPDVRRGVARVEWCADQGPVDLIASFEGERFDSRLAGLPSPRLLAHQFFDSESKQLTRRVRSEKGSRSSEFEAGVASLLHLCGFAVESLGGGTVDREVDLIAFLDSDIVLVGECTAEVPDDAKCTKFARRAFQCVRAIGSERPTTLCVVFTPVSVFTQQDYTCAARAGVVLLGASDIDELLAMAKRNEPPREVAKFMSLRRRSPFF